MKFLVRDRISVENSKYHTPTSSVGTKYAFPTELIRLQKLSISMSAADRRYLTPNRVFSNFAKSLLNIGYFILTKKFGEFRKEEIIL
jgi:hypothetical protein